MNSSGGPTAWPRRGYTMTCVMQVFFQRAITRTRSLSSTSQSAACAIEIPGCNHRMSTSRSAQSFQRLAVSVTFTPCVYALSKKAKRCAPRASSKRAPHSNRHGVSSTITMSPAEYRTCPHWIFNAVQHARAPYPWASSGNGSNLPSNLSSQRVLRMWYLQVHA